MTVPGAIAGWFDLLDRWGTMSFGDLATDAVRYARDGFVLTPLGAAAAQGYGPLYRDFVDWQAVYGGLATGDVLRQEPLARLVETLAEDGPDAYYRGPVATDIEAAVARLGGLMTTEDLAAHAGAWQDPLRCAYRDVEVAELPPPTQGVAALEILRILDGFDLAGMDPGARGDVVVEAVKLGLRDRDDHVSDPGAMSVTPADLLDDAWIGARRDAVDLDRATVPVPGRPQRGGTAYLCAADGDGLLVSLIQSNFLGSARASTSPRGGSTSTTAARRSRSTGHARTRSHRRSCRCTR